MLIPVLDSYLGRENTPAHSYMNVNPVKGGRRMEDTLVISFRDNFFNDGSLARPVGRLQVQGVSGGEFSGGNSIIF